MSTAPAAILLLVPSLIRAGAETQAISLANGLARRGFAVHLATFGQSLDQLDRVDHERVVFHRLQRRGRLGLSLIHQLAQLLREQRIALIHCTLQISLFYAVAARTFSRLKVPLVTAIHTTQNLSAREERFDRYLYRPLMGRCARTVFVCHAQAEYWAQRFPELRAGTAVIYNGIDAEHFAPRPEHSADGLALGRSLGIDEGAPVLACVARLRPEKGHLLLLQALAAHDDSRVQLVLAGDGPMRGQIERSREELGLRGRVHLLGDVADTRSLFALADASVLASTSVETFSMAMLESLSMATPMIATDIGGMGEAIRTGQTGWLVPAGDVPALTAAIGEATTGGSLASDRGQAGRASILQAFTVQKMVGDMAQLLGEVAPASVPASTAAGT